MTELRTWLFIVAMRMTVLTHLFHRRMIVSVFDTHIPREHSNMPDLGFLYLCLSLYIITRSALGLLPFIGQPAWELLLNCLHCYGVQTDLIIYFAANYVISTVAKSKCFTSILFKDQNQTTLERTLHFFVWQGITRTHARPMTTHPPQCNRWVWQLDFVILCLHGHAAALIADSAGVGTLELSDLVSLYSCHQQQRCLI